MNTDTKVKRWKGEQGRINRAAGKVVDAIISSGYYEFKINRKDEYCEIEILAIILSPYTYLRVYEDGTIQYFDGHGLQFEGPSNNKKSIIRDILHK